MQKRFVGILLSIVPPLFINAIGYSDNSGNGPAALAMHSGGRNPAVYSSAPAGCSPYTLAVSRGLDFLKRKQVKVSFKVGGPNLMVSDYTGDWPQFFFTGLPELRIREVSPFIPTFIHHALTFIVEENLQALGLPDRYAREARLMRQRAVAFMQRFAARDEDSDRGTFGFWLHNAGLDEEETLLENILFEYFQGPILGGSRVPINLGFFPDKLAIPGDADVTATVYASLRDDSLIDGGPGSDMAVERFFADWRDTGAVPRRLNPAWLPSASGVFLTWLSYHDPPDLALPNDVDLVVNANVLFALARCGALHTPGVAEAVDLINTVTQEGYHRTKHNEISAYYPDNFAFHYCVSRAYYEGPVPELQPAVEILADDLEGSAHMRADGTVFWDKGSPVLNTALAVLTLLNADRTGVFMERAVDYLIAEQHALSGGWDEGVFFTARLESGLQVNWVASSLTTAIVIEALCRYQLALNNSIN